MLSEKEKARLELLQDILDPLRKATDTYFKLDQEYQELEKKKRMSEALKPGTKVKIVCAHFNKGKGEICVIKYYVPDVDDYLCETPDHKFTGYYPKSCLEVVKDS